MSCYDCYYFKKKVGQNWVVCQWIMECYVGVKDDCEHFKPKKR